MLSYSKSFIKVLTKGFTFVKYTVHQMKNYVNFLTSLPNPLPLPSTKFFPSNTSIILSFILFLPSFLPFYFQFLPQYKNFRTYGAKLELKPPIHQYYCSMIAIITGSK